MRCAMRKPCAVLFEIFKAILTKLKNYLSTFPGSYESKKMDEAEINKILLHTVPNGWAKQ